MRRGTTLLFALLLSTVSPGVRGQNPAPEARTELVRLDVVVTDSEGHLVPNLKRDAFELLEDGKPQELSHFLAVDRRGTAPAAEAGGSAIEQPPATGAASRARSERAPASVPAGAEAAAADASRYVVIVVDDLHISGGNIVGAKEALLRFVNESVQPTDQVALITTGVPLVVQQLTLDRAVLRQAINRLGAREAQVAPTRGTQMTPAQAELILSGNTTALRLAAQSLITEPGSIYDGISPIVAAAAPPSAEAQVAGATGADAKERVASDEAKRQARGVLYEALRFSGATLGTLDGVIRAIADLPGRKLCLLVSDGFLVGRGIRDEHALDARRVVDAATRSGAVVYSLDSRGLVTSLSDASVVGRAVAPGLQEAVGRQAEQLFHATLNELADDTGGFVVRGTNDLANGLSRMLSDNDVFYLMAYEPANLKRDGRFRKIEVRLPGHPDYRVRTRQGYYAPDERKKPDPGQQAAQARLAGLLTPAVDPAEAERLLATPLAENALPVRLTADFLDVPPVGAQVVVRGQVDLGQLDWDRAGDRSRASIELVGALYDQDGKRMGAPFGKRADLDLSEAERKRAIETGLLFHEQIPVSPGRYRVRLVARDPDHAMLGGASQQLEVPDLSDHKLAMSSVFLTSSLEPAAAAPTAGVAEGEHFRDAHTLRRFRRDESLYFQTYVYNASVGEDGKRDVVLQAQIWSGGKAIAASKPQPVALQQRDGVPLPETNGMSLASLTPGRYELRVVVVDSRAKATVQRSVDFTVE